MLGGHDLDPLDTDTATAPHNPRPAKATDASTSWTTGRPKGIVRENSELPPPPDKCSRQQFDIEGRRPRISAGFGVPRERRRSWEESTARLLSSLVPRAVRA